MTKERPIIFSAPMVRAILDGRKTQTRRAIKVQHGPKAIAAGLGYDLAHCPYGVVGSRLWVRETWGVGSRPDPFDGWRDGIELRADCEHTDAIDLLPLYPAPEDVDLSAIKSGWRSPIHMPRWASRITLEITDVRVERLQAISEADAMAEGAPPSHPSIDAVSREFGYADFPRSWYAQTWDHINGHGSWDANPWVWCVSFRRVTP